MNDVLTVANKAQQVLFYGEILGQLSDGAWENSSPHNHYMSWSKCACRVGTPIGRNFYPAKYNYNLSSPELLKAIGPRMIGIVKLMNAGYLNGVDARDWNIKIYAEAGADFGDWDLPSSESFDAYINTMKSSSDDYFKKKYSELERIFGSVDNLKKILLSNTYTKQELVRDLNGLKLAFRTRSV